MEKTYQNIDTTSDKKIDSSNKKQYVRNMAHIDDFIELTLLLSVHTEALTRLDDIPITFSLLNMRGSDFG